MKPAALRAIVGKGLYGLGLRGAQAFVLLLVVIRFGDEAQSDVAVILAAAVSLNLVTNFGLPTVLVRQKIGEANEAAVRGIARLYAVLTAAGAAFLLLGVTAFLGSFAAGVSCALLLVGLSASGFVEYWALARADYEAFLRYYAPLHVVASLTACVFVVVTREPYLGVAVLALSPVVPLATSWTRRTISEVARAAASGTVARSDPWLASAARVGVASVAGAVLYGADVFLLRATGHVGEDAVYRLAIACVGTAVGVLPASFFAVAWSAAGDVLDWRRSLFAVSLVATGICLIVGSASYALDGTARDVGELLVLLAPLAGLRLVTQVAAAHLHGKGRHEFVGRAFVLGAVVFCVAGAVGAALAGTYGVVVAQLLVEVGVASTLLAYERAWALQPPVVNTHER